jgi:hypothetical protein
MQLLGSLLECGSGAGRTQLRVSCPKEPQASCLRGS